MPHPCFEEWRVLLLQGLCVPKPPPDLFGKRTSCLMFCCRSPFTQKRTTDESRLVVGCKDHARVWVEGNLVDNLIRLARMSRSPDLHFRIVGSNNIPMV